jgi:IMP cyclohydrolase
MTRVDEMSASERAKDNFESHLERNPYPGRGLVVGRSSDALSWLFVYFIMGRSSNSRNRRFVAEAEVLRTEPVDMSLVEDPSLIIYEAMLEGDDTYFVSNGDQTRTIHDALARGESFDSALATREREPDAPNYTPRISAMLDLGSDNTSEASFAMSILKANPLDPEETDRTTFRPATPQPGFGVLLTTYQGDGSPLPSFVGEPLSVPCAGTPEEILEQYWKALDSENRISLAVKRIASDGSGSSLHLKNRF